MAVVFSDLGSEWGHKKLLFGEETEGEKKVVEELAAASRAKDSATSKVPYEGVRRLYPCLCYPKELLKKEDEVRYVPHYEEMLPNMFNLWAIKQRYNKEVLPKMVNECATIRRYLEDVELRRMFNEWATKHSKRYIDLHEWRLRYKIWLNTKEMKEQVCSNSGRMFSMKEMTMAADMTVRERRQLNIGRVKPSERPLCDVKRKLLDTMGKSWMEEAGKGFDEWAERHKRVYRSTEEREKRLLAYLDNMRTIHLSEKQCPGEWGHGNDLENMDKFPWEASLAPGATCSRCGFSY